MAALPTRLVEIEFDAGTWTDVSADVVSVTTRRGRNKESGAFETGSMEVQLRNDTRTYDPDNGAGAYYGKLRPNRRIRFRATYNAVTYPVFQGYIDGITQDWGGPNDATATVRASDIFKLLNRTELAVSAFAAEVAADTPAYWWRLGEPAGAVKVIDAVAGATATVTGTATLGAAGLVTRDPDTALDAANTGGSVSTQGAFYNPQATIATGYPLTLSAIVRPTAGMNAGTVLALLDASNNNVAFLAADPISGSAVFQVYTTASLVTATGAVNIYDGNPHLISGVWDAAGVARVYVDGVATGSTPTLTGTVNPAASLSINGSPAVNGMVGTVDEAAIYTTAISAARLLAQSNARAAPWNADLPGTRLGRVLDLAAIPAADRNLDAGTTTLQSTSLGGSALAYAQKVEETEIGRLFVAKDGKVRFIGRQAADTGGYLTSQATLVDADSGAGLPYATASADVDEATIVTRSTVSRDGSVAVTYADTGALAEFKVIDEAHDGLLHNDDTYSLYYAQWIVNTHKTPGSRVGTVGLELPQDPAAMYPAILALEIADRVTWKRKPQNTGSITALTMRVEAIAHSTGAGSWHTGLSLTPFYPAGGTQTGVWDTSLWDQANWGL